jgi:hypothetical protein
MRFNSCWHVLKHLEANEIIMKLYECLFHFHYSHTLLFASVGGKHPTMV